MKLRSLLGLAALSFIACGDDDEASEVAPPGPVCASFLVLRPRGNEEVFLPDRCETAQPGSELASAGAPAEPAPVPPAEELEVVIGCDRQLGVDLRVDNWTFRPPYACGGTPQCGYVLLELDPADLDPAPTQCRLPAPAGAVSEAGAGGAAEAPPATAATCNEVALQRGVLDLTPLGDALAGPHLLRATLINSDRTRFLAPCTEAGGRCFDSIVLPVTFAVEACTDGSEGGAGGVGGAGDAGGAGGAAG